MNLSFFIHGLSNQSAAVRHITQDGHMARLSSAFRVYYRLRPLIPVAVRRRLQRSRRVEATGRWYFPDAFFALLLEELAAEPAAVPIVAPWPDGSRFALTLTHDVETQAGFRSIAKVAEMEEQLGFRSAWYIVPHKYKIDEGLLRDLRARSFEIGIHGYNHDGRLYSSKKEFERRAALVNAALERYGAVGFRSPMVHRNLQWLQLLKIEYDASCFDADPYQPMPGGVGSIWPFTAGKFVELPYTLPQDHTLFVALGERDGRIWEKKRDFLVRHRGMMLMLTHPDYLTTLRRLDAYRRFLITTRQLGGCWHALPKEVAAWWKARELSAPVTAPDGRWIIRGPAASAGSVISVGAYDGELFFGEAPHRKPAPRSSYAM